MFSSAEPAIARAINLYAVTDSGMMARMYESG